MADLALYLFLYIFAPAYSGFPNKRESICFVKTGKIDFTFLALSLLKFMPKAICKHFVKDWACTTFFN